MPVSRLVCRANAGRCALQYRVPLTDIVAGDLPQQIPDVEGAHTAKNNLFIPPRAAHLEIVDTVGAVDRPAIVEISFGSVDVPDVT